MVSDEVAPLAGNGVANDRTDLLKVGFVFFKEGDAYGSRSCAIDPSSRGDKATEKQ